MATSDDRDDRDYETTGEGSTDGGDGNTAEGMVVDGGEGPSRKSRMSLLLLILLLGVGAGSVYLMAKKAGPASAGAAVIPTEASRAQAAVKQFLAEPNKRGLSLNDLLANTQAVIQRFTGYPRQNQVPLTELPGNPFRLGVAASATGSGDEEEARKRSEAVKAAIAKEAGTLQLQSLMVGEAGGKPAAIINGQAVSQGMVVGGFTVVSIDRGRVVVEKQGLKFALSVGK